MITDGNFLRRIFVIAACLSAVSCGQRYTFSATSGEHIQEVRVTCVGPHGEFSLENEGAPFARLLLSRKGETTEILLAPDPDNSGSDPIWPEQILVMTDNRETYVPESGEVGKTIMRDDIAYYLLSDTPDALSVAVGTITIGDVSKNFDPIEFRYGKRRYMLCLQ